MIIIRLIPTISFLYCSFNHSSSWRFSVLMLINPIIVITSWPISNVTDWSWCSDWSWSNWRIYWSHIKMGKMQDFQFIMRIMRIMHIMHIMLHYTIYNININKLFMINLWSSDWILIIRPPFNSSCWEDSNDMCFISVAKILTELYQFKVLAVSNHMIFA